MSLQELAQKLESMSATEKCNAESTLPGLTLYRATAPADIDAIIYDPIVCLIVQGEKMTTIGDETVLLQEGGCVVVGHDLPVLAQIIKASPTTPYLSLVIRLDVDLLRSLDDLLDQFEVEDERPRSLEISEVTEPIVNVLERYVDLARDPLEAKVLLPLIQKELHFRLLQSASGAMLRQLVNRDSHASSIGRAIGRLRETFRETLDVSELAKSVGMSPSSFHKHFKSMTRTTPLQYQKDLRLTEARRLLRTGESTVSSAAFAVGYESSSQFSREYSRKFGAPPRADLQVA